MGRIGPRTNRGHQWANSHDNERVECVWCMCSPLSDAAKYQCDAFGHAESHNETDHIPVEGTDTEEETP
jgi:hypothetical protein